MLTVPSARIVNIAYNIYILMETKALSFQGHLPDGRSDLLDVRLAAHVELLGI
jgi:hypothetical protein